MIWLQIVLIANDLKQIHIKKVMAAFHNIEKPSLLTSSDLFISKGIAQCEINTHFIFAWKHPASNNSFWNQPRWHSHTSVASYTVCWGVSAEQEIGSSSLPFDLLLSDLCRCNTVASWEMGGGDWEAGEEIQHWPRQHIRGRRPRHQKYWLPSILLLLLLLISADAV